VTNPVSGQELSQQVTAHISFNSVQVHATGLPNSAATQLAAGTSVNVPVQVTNTGNLPLTFFADPRLNTNGTLGLTELSGNATVPLPVPAGITPVWLDPTETQKFAVSVTASQPVNVDMNYNSGEPELYAPAAGNPTVDTVTSPRQVSPGIWGVNLGQTGPFSGPAPAGTANLSASAVGQLFDLDTTSTTGDVWTAGVATQSPLVSQAVVKEVVAHAKDARTILNGGTIHMGHATKFSAKSQVKPADTPPAQTGPLTLNPGQTGTIIVTITPSGTSGSVVHGTLYIDDFDFLTTAGDELVALPYSYTIK
jgi:hypothetical protein